MDPIALHPDMAAIWAEECIKARWGIKSPPPWLMCFVMGVPYRVLCQVHVK